MTQDELKAQVGERAAALVENNMRVGLGTGSTANFFVKSLAIRVQNGLKIVGVPTSIQTMQLAQSLGIPLTTLEETPQLDITIDGADEMDAQLTLIKGGGAALLREKIVAQASHTMIVIADASKQVKTLGKFPLPIEVNPFGLNATTKAVMKALEKNSITPNITVRKNKDGQTLVTDGGHYILDAHCGIIPHSHQLSDDLHAIAGVVEHGLFIGIAKKALVAGSHSVQEISIK